MKDKDVLDRLARSKDLPALAPAVAHILRALEAEESDSAVIARLVSGDVAISGRLFAIANSVLYNPSGTPLESMELAVSRLGFDRVKHVVSTIGVIDAFGGSRAAFDPLEFWKHCLTTAIAAGALAQRSTKIATVRPGQNSYYVAGLMHDVGVFLLSHSFGKRYGKILNQAQEGGVALIEVETDRLGFTHCEAGAALLRAWGLPTNVVEAAGHHHDPGDAPTESRLTAQIVHLADWISSQQGLGLVFEGDFGHFAEGAWFDIGIEVDTIPDVIADFAIAAGDSDLMLALTKR